MQNISAKFRYMRIVELIEKANSLPNTIIDSEDFEGGEANHLYKEKRIRLLSAAKDIKMELRSFVKTCYGSDNEYFGAVGEIYFANKPIGGHIVIMNTYNVNNNTQWQEGRHILVSILNTMEAEEKERVNMEKFMVDKTLPLRYGGTGILVLLSMFAIWLAPPETMAKVFAPANFFAARFVMSACMASICLAIIVKDKWKEIIGSAFVGTAIALIPLLKTEPAIQNQLPKSDTIAIKKVGIIRAENDSLKIK